MNASATGDDPRGTVVARGVARVAARGVARDGTRSRSTRAHHHLGSGFSNLFFRVVAASGRRDSPLLLVSATRRSARISELASRADSGATRGLLLPPASAPGGPRSDAHPADGRRASHLRVVLETLAKGEEHTRSSTRARADRPSSARRVVPRPPRRRRVPFLLREDGAGGPTPQAAVPDGPGRPTGGTAGPIEDGHRHHHGCVSRAPRRPRPRARGGVPRFRAPRPARPRNKQP